MEPALLSKPVVISSTDILLFNLCNYLCGSYCFVVPFQRWESQALEKTSYACCAHSKLQVQTLGTLTAPLLCRTASDLTDVSFYDGVVHYAVQRALIEDYGACSLFRDSPQGTAITPE